jgi:hypothetical protein
MVKDCKKQAISCKLQGEEADKEKGYQELACSL